MLTSLQTPENWTCLMATSATYQAGQSLTCPSSIAHPLSNSDVLSFFLSLPLSPSLSLSLPLSPSLSLSLPCRIFSHSQLTEIVAGYNKLTAIPPAIGTLCLLTVLDLRYIQLHHCVTMTCTSLLPCIRCHVTYLRTLGFPHCLQMSAFFHCIMTLCSVKVCRASCPPPLCIPPETTS